MGRKGKYKHVINWTIIGLIISVILGIVPIAIAIIFNYNQSEISILKTEISQLERENTTLTSQLDPVWHQKLNSQKLYYENEIAGLEKNIKSIEHSLVNMKAKGYLLDTNNIVISKEVAKKIIKDLHKGDLDSARADLFQVQVVLLQKQVELRSGIAEIQAKQIDNYKKLAKLDNTPSNKFNGVLLKGLFGVAILACIISCVAWYKIYASNKRRSSVEL